ncbi:MAG: hypothetical protein H6662_10020 [Ardenticatenaceae bacterium]|nr:hypothetical protein [Anaerolineales bacterium]MCB8921911.1 hypothetical protein [Ardenticatenaceae bacterium]MCB8989486.1 hypothetical protein [Ardenticatenaceae bacterium]
MSANSQFTIHHSLFIIFTRAGLATAVIVTAAIWFGYFYHPYDQETACDDIPANSVVLVSGFDYRLGADGELLPGAGNQFLAQKLVDCAGRLTAVVTQQAVIEALIEQGVLREGKLNGVPVYAMHQHCAATPVRTLSSLQCALHRLSPLPNQLVVLAHDKHQQRVVQDLRSIFDGEIIEWQVIDAPYATENPLAPFCWALRELFLARPAEAFLRWAGQQPQLAPLTMPIVNVLGGFDCPEHIETKEKIMLETEVDHENDDLDEARRHWEGIHNDEAAQYRVMFEDTSNKELAACCLLPGVAATAVTLAIIFGLYRLILTLF